jgi:hypothetical protein
LVKRGRHALLSNIRASIFCCLVLALRPAPSFAQAATTELTSEEQSRLAAQYAPVLVFHPEEKYFPCSPLFALATTDTASLAALLGTPDSRTASYEALSIEEKAKLAKVYYRVYRLRRTPYEAIVLEYWFYYVQDTYHVRGNLIPFWLDASHPNDMEHIQIVLRSPGNTISEVISSAHEGRIPANRFRFPSEAALGRIHILVERGSHANAADINKDGMFTPHVDGDSGYKIIWGIRDKGVTWVPYNPSNMTSRAHGAVIFSPGSDTDPAPGSHSYQLEPTEQLSLDVKSLPLTEKQRNAAFETQVSWFTRLMGRSNGSPNALLSPPEPNLRRRTIDTGKYSSTERGFLVGFTNLMPRAGFLLGGRYSFQNGYRYLPDVMFEADGIVNTNGKGYLSTDAMLTYPIDAATKFMFGTGVFTDSIRYRNYERDWIAATEVRLGRMRIYAAGRSWGPVTQSSVDFRLFYLF